MGIDAKSQIQDLQIAKPIDDQAPEFTPLPYTLAEIRAAIPSHLFERDTFRAMKYLLRNIVLAVVTWEAGAWIDPFCDSMQRAHPDSALAFTLLRAAGWLT